MAKALNVPRDTVGSIVCKFKVEGTVVTRPGRGRKRKPSAAATRFLRRQVVENPRVTAKHLQQDLVAAGTEVSVCTVRRTLNTDGVPCPDSNTHTTTDPKAQGKSAPIC